MAFASCLTRIFPSGAPTPSPPPPSVFGPPWTITWSPLANWSGGESLAIHVHCYEDSLLSVTIFIYITKINPAEYGQRKTKHDSDHIIASDTILFSILFQLTCVKCCNSKSTFLYTVHLYIYIIRVLKIPVQNLKQPQWITDCHVYHLDRRVEVSPSPSEG